jgi:hypothetical protein
VRSSQLKTLLLNGNAEFWAQLSARTRSAHDFKELFLLSSLRKKAHARKLAKPDAAARNPARHFRRLQFASAA